MWRSVSNYTLLFGILTWAYSDLRPDAEDRDDRPRVRGLGLGLAAAGGFILPMFANKYFSDAVEDHNKSLPQDSGKTAILMFNFQF